MESIATYGVVGVQYRKIIRHQIEEAVKEEIMVILAWIIIVILFLLISNYYFYKTDTRTRKKAFLYAIIETIGAFFTSRW